MCNLEYKSFFKENKYWLIDVRNGELTRSCKKLGSTKHLAEKCIKRNLNINTLLIFKAIGRFRLEKNEEVDKNANN